MKNHSVFIKSFACILSTAAMVGTYAYSLEPKEKREIDYSAFKNAAANLKHLTSTASEKTNEMALNDVNKQIVAVIEKELQKEIQATSKKTAIKPRLQASQKVAKKSVPKVAQTQLLTTIYPSSFEINNSQLVYLWGFEFDKLSYESFQNTEIALIQEDEVKVAQAATEKVVPVAELAEEKIDLGDDLVVFDYSSPSSEEVVSAGPIEPAVEEKIEETTQLKIEHEYKISNVVKNAISRELERHRPVVNIHGQEKAPIAQESLDTESLESLINSDDAIVYDYSSVTQAMRSKGEETLGNAFVSSNVTQITSTLKAFEVKFGNDASIETLNNFEFVPDYDRAERVHDSGSGEISFVATINEDVSTQTGIVQAQGTLPTRIKLNLLKESNVIPMFNEMSIHQYLEKEQVELHGNFILIEKSQAVKDVEIDVSHAYKVLMNENFSMVDTLEEAKYVFFMGTGTGNVLIRYLLNNSKTMATVAHVGEGEVYFEAPMFETGSRELFTLNTRSLLGTKIRELNINAQDVSLFGVNTQSRKRTINSYEFNLSEKIFGERRYLEFKHLGYDLIVGTGKQRELEIPGADFIRKAIEVNGLASLENRCMVQVNLSNDVRNLKVGGKNKSGEMFVEVTYLDHDGNFSVDSSELSEKAFIVGDQEGILNARIEYSDGSEQFLKTYCSEGSYIVEQL